VGFSFIRDGRTLLLADGECEVDCERADCGQLTETAEQHESSQVVGRRRPLVACVLDVRSKSHRREYACIHTHACTNNIVHSNSATGRIAVLLGGEWTCPLCALAARDRVATVLSARSRQVQAVISRWFVYCSPRGEGTNNRTSRCVLGLAEV